jgi:hypothetical protein
MSQNVALLLASPGDVSESQKAGIQFVAKMRENEAHQRKAYHSMDGVLFDVGHMKQLLREKDVRTYNAVYQLRFTKEHALETITTFFLENTPSQFYIIYYSGHGEELTGNWVFTNGTISYHEIISAWSQSGKSERYGLWLISDSCFAGQWIQQAQSLSTSNCMLIRILCSSEGNKVSYDTEGGGDFTINFTQGNDRKLRTPAVSCEILYGQMQKIVMHSTIGNYVKRNWLLSAYTNSSNYAEFSDTQDELSTSHSQLYSDDDMRHERMQQAHHLRQERVQQAYRQQHERLDGLYQNRSARMLEVKQNQSQRMEKAHQQWKQ